MSYLAILDTDDDGKRARDDNKGNKGIIIHVLYVSRNMFVKNKGKFKNKRH